MSLAKAIPIKTKQGETIDLVDMCQSLGGSIYGTTPGGTSIEFYLWKSFQKKAFKQIFHTFFSHTTFFHLNNKQQQTKMLDIMKSWQTSSPQVQDVSTEETCYCRCATHQKPP